MIAGLLGHVLWRRLGAAYWNPQGWRLRTLALLLAATVYTLLDEPLDFEENLLLQRFLAALVAVVLLVFAMRSAKALRAE